MNKEDKEFFEKNKQWLFMIVLAIFVTEFEYINMFENVIFNSIVNMLFGIIEIILLYLFFQEEKEWINSNSQFTSVLVKVLIAMGIVTSFYHIGYAVGQLIAIALL